MLKLVFVLFGFFWVMWFVKVDGVICLELRGGFMFFLRYFGLCVNVLIILGVFIFLFDICCFGLYDNFLF